MRNLRRLSVRFQSVGIYLFSNLVSANLDQGFHKICSEQFDNDGTCREEKLTHHASNDAIIKALQCKGYRENLKFSHVYKISKKNIVSY